MVGGACVNTGTIPSKTLRETVLYLTGLSQREVYGQSYRVKSDITMQDLSGRTAQVVTREIQVVQDQLARNRVKLMFGPASFVDDHTVVIDHTTGKMKVTAAHIVIATGTRPARPANVAFDDQTVVDSDGILKLDRVPASLVIVGAGVIGIEYASIFAALGCKVTVVERRDRMLEFCDEEIVQALQYHLRDLAVSFRFRETVAAVEAHGGRTLTVLESGKTIPADAVMYSAGRLGSTDLLGLHSVGIPVDDRKRIRVDGNYRTSVPHIYAIGDVIGFPALAATSMEQGRLAAYHAFGEISGAIDASMPVGIYTIPEISYIGRTEAELTAASTTVRGGHLALPRARARPDRRRLERHLEASGVARDPQAPGRPHLRDERDGDGPHRAGRDGLRRHGGLSRRRGLQLPDALRGVQGGRARRDQQASRRQRAAHRLSHRSPSSKRGRRAAKPQSRREKRGEGGQEGRKVGRISGFSERRAAR